MPMSPAPIAASWVFVLFALSAQARAIELPPFEVDETVVRELIAAPSQELPADSPPHVVPVVAARLEGGDLVYETTTKTRQNGDEPVNMRYPRTCGAAAELREMVLEPPLDSLVPATAREDYVCMSRLGITARGSYQSWSCYDDDENYYITRIMAVMGEYLVVYEEVNETYDEIGTMQSKVEVNAIAAPGGACPAASE